MRVPTHARTPVHAHALLLPVWFLLLWFFPEKSKHAFILPAHPFTLLNITITFHFLFVRDRDTTATAGTQTSIPTHPPVTNPPTHPPTFFLTKQKTDSVQNATLSIHWKRGLRLFVQEKVFCLPYTVLVGLFVCYQHFHLSCLRVSRMGVFAVAVCWRFQSTCSVWYHPAS